MRGPRRQPRPGPQALDADERGGPGDDQPDRVRGSDETGHLGRLAADASDSALESIGHHMAERAGTALEPDHPGQAARLWRAQAMRILKPGKSKYYDAALRYFKHAKHCYQQAGQAAQ